MIEIVLGLIDIFGFFIQYPIFWGFIFCLIFFVSQAKWDVQDDQQNLQGDPQTKGTGFEQKTN